MKKLTLILLLFIASFSLKAQSLVSIPDSNFVTWLTINIPSAMSGSQMNINDTTVTGRTSIDISYDSIFDLSGIQYFTSLQILNCTANQLDSLPSLPDSLKTLYCSANRLTSLPTLPASLQTLECDGNLLTWLPSLPGSITTFSCQQNHLDTLPALPPMLPILRCSNNLLTRLPTLPNSLVTIECETNELDSLPALPSSLVYLNCQNNVLTSLPVLPVTLATLICNTNQLTTLPALPSALTTLECYSNLLPNLPTLPASLVYLNCSTNPMPALPVLPNSLQQLKCYNDLLPTLPILPASLTYLDCSANILTSLPALPGSLIFLNCSFNQLPALPALSALQILHCNNNLLTILPTLPVTLQYLSCGFNPLANLPALSSLVELFCDHATLDSLPTLPNSLVFLNCSANNIDSLPALPNALNYLACNMNPLIALPTLPGSLFYLDCSNDQLAGLPTIPASLSELNCQNNLITCMPEFPNTMTYLGLYGNPFTCLANYIPTMDSLTLSMYPLCVYGDLINNPNNCTSARGLVGFAFTDNNSNCMKDSTDFNLINVPVRVYDSVGTLLSQTYTASNGVYSFAEPAGTYTAVIDTTGMPFFPQCLNPGIDSTVTTTTTTPLITDINFDFNCKPGFDVGVRSITHTGIAFPGELDNIKIWAGDMTHWFNMNCAAGISGTIQIKVIGPVTFAGISTGALMPVITGSIYTYIIADFGSINNVTAFGLKFFTDTTAAAGDNICVSVSVTPIGGDNDSSNNHYNYCYPVVNSHDPNFKETTPEVVSPDYDGFFTYAIHFQNTGNAAAINIRLADTLDNNLDLSTFELLNYSHENITSLTGNILNVNFPNIMLADSTSSSDSSKGFIQYRIKAKPGRPLGTYIYNTGYIYFDYNTAIITNTTINLYRGISTGINESENAELIVYPNPSAGIFTLKITGSKDESEIVVYNLLGEIILIANSQNETTQIDLSSEPNGVYILKVNSIEGAINRRLIKQ